MSDSGQSSNDPQGRIKHYWLSQLVLLLLGALIGAIVSDAVASTDLRLAAAVALCASLALSIAVLFIYEEAQTVGKVLSSIRQTKNELVLAETESAETIRAMLDQEHEALLERLTELGKMVRFEAQFLRSEEVSLEYNPVYDCLCKAQSEILVLDRYIEYDRPDMNLGGPVLERSIATYLALATGNQRGKYCRVIQTDSGNADALNRSGGTDVFTAHYRDVLDANNPRATLHVSKVMSTNKFTVIDSEVVVLQIHRRRPDTDRYEVEGELILRDPSGQLGGIFKDIFEKAHYQSTVLRREHVPSFWQDADE